MTYSVHDDVVITEHAADLMTRRQRGHDGRTGYSRLKGKESSIKFVEFGESCLYKLHKKGPEADERGKLEPRWDIATFVGFNRESNEYKLMIGGHMVYARTIKRRPKNLRWNPRIMGSHMDAPDVQYG